MYALKQCRGDIAIDMLRMVKDVRSHYFLGKHTDTCAVDTLAKPLELARQKGRASLPGFLDFRNRIEDPDTSQPVASSSKISSTTATFKPYIGVSKAERFLQYLSLGLGLRAYDFEGLFEQCDKCDKYFVNIYLRDHVAGCDGPQASIRRPSVEI